MTLRDLLLQFWQPFRGMAYQTETYIVHPYSEGSMGIFCASYMFPHYSEIGVVSGNTNYSLVPEQQTLKHCEVKFREFICSWHKKIRPSLATETKDDPELRSIRNVPVKMKSYLSYPSVCRRRNYCGENTDLRILT
jgi:hypothetical protein